MNVWIGRSLTLFFMGITGYMLWASLTLSRIAAWIPQLVLTVTLILLGWQATRDWRNARKLARRPNGPESVGTNSGSRATREKSVLAWITALLLAAWALGLIFGNALFCFAWLRWHAGERWLVCVVFASVLGALLWIVFSALLGTELYAGVLISLIPGTS